MPDIPQFIVERSRAPEPVVTADEVAKLAAGQFEQLTATGILVPAKNASSVACEDCGQHHVELVEFVESPPGSKLRAYIACPENGRVSVPLGRLQRWSVNLDAVLAAQDEGVDRVDLRTVYLHYEPGHRVYACVVDSQKRPFDFTANCFRPISELARQQDACLFATGRWDTRADYGFSYSARFNLFRLVAKIPAEAVPADGIVFTVAWLIQEGEEPALRDDTVLLNSCRVRYVNGQFTAVDSRSEELFDEKLTFARKEQWYKAKGEFETEEFRKDEELAVQLSTAISTANVGDALRVAAESLSFWARGLRQHLHDHCYLSARDPHVCAMYRATEDDEYVVQVDWIVRRWIGMQEAYDLLEFHKGSEFAEAFSSRVQDLFDARDAFSARVAEVTAECGCHVDPDDVEELEEGEKELRNLAFQLCHHLNLVAAQCDAAANGQVAPAAHPTRQSIQVVTPSGQVPHALAVAYHNAVSLLKPAMDLYGRELCFPNPDPVLGAIERFVHELRLVPNWSTELRRRGCLVERKCAAGSVYEHARQQALQAQFNAPAGLHSAALALNRLRKTTTQNPVFLQELMEIRKNIETLLRDQSCGLSAAAATAFQSWRDEARSIQLEAERLEVDGCRYLNHLYASAGQSPSDEEQFARAWLKTNVGGVHLERILLAVESMVAWVGEGGLSSADGQVDSNVTTPIDQRKNRGKQVPAKKSWTQPDLDAAIRTYKSERASTYQDIIEGVKAGRTGAKEAARKMFGRNVVADALGVKARAMVTKSPEWQAIAEELRLSRGKDRNRKASQKVGLDIAIEQQASTTMQTGLDRAVQDETIRFIQSSMPREMAEATIEKLQRREITDEQARDLVEAVKEQEHDRRTRKVRSSS